MSSVNRSDRVPEDVVDGHTKSEFNRINKPLERLRVKSGENVIRVPETESPKINELEKLIQKVSGLTEESRKKAFEEYNTLKEIYEEVKGDPSKYAMFAAMEEQKNIGISSRTDTLKRNAFYLAKALDLAEQQFRDNQEFVEKGWSEFVLLLNADFVYKFINDKIKTSSYTEKTSPTTEGGRMDRMKGSRKFSSPGDRSSGYKSRSFSLGDPVNDEKNVAASNMRHSEMAKDLQVTKQKQQSLESLLHAVKDGQQKEKAQMEYRQLVSCFDQSYGPGAFKKTSSCDNTEIQDLSPVQRAVAPELYNILLNEASKEEREKKNLELAVGQYLKLTEHKIACDEMKSVKEARQNDLIDQVHGPSVQAASSDTPRSKGHGDEKSYILRLLMNGKFDEEVEHLRRKAMREYQHLHHNERLLQKEYSFIESTREIESNVKGPDDIIDHQSARSLFNFLRRLLVRPQVTGYVETWQEYDRLLQSEQLLIMAQIMSPGYQSQVAVKPQVHEGKTVVQQAQTGKCKHGAVTNSHVLIPRTSFEELKQDLRRKDEQINDLTTRLSRYASQLLLDNNPNIADLSDKNRPTRLGEMFGILYDDQWSEAFEAVTQSKPPCEEDDLCVEVLELLQSIVMTCFSFCKQETKNQFEKVKKSMTISFIVGDEPTDREMTDGMAKELSQFTNRQTKTCMISAAGICHKKAAKVFCEKVLPDILQDKLLQTDSRMLAYVSKCVELCWYMCVQDPPMTIKCSNKGDKVNLSSYAYHYRKGKVVLLCVWPAVFLYEGGPLVKKGFVLPS